MKLRCVVNIRALNIHYIILKLQVGMKLIWTVRYIVRCFVERCRITPIASRLHVVLMDSIHQFHVCGFETDAVLSLLI